MFTYTIRLSPKPGGGFGNILTQVRASSETQARHLAEAQYPGYRVEVVQRVGT